MTTDTVPQTVLFPDLFDKPLFAKFNQEQASSDGGAVLLKAAERVYGLVKAFARCLSDKRAPEEIRHTLADLIGQRIFGIACGHPDCNDAEHLADDPIHKLLLGRDPVAGESLASQPTLSRFENAVTYVAYFALLTSTGLRLSEACRLTTDDADLVNGILTIRETSSTSPDSVPLHPTTTQALAPLGIPVKWNSVSGIWNTVSGEVERSSERSDVRRSVPSPRCRSRSSRFYS